MGAIVDCICKDKKKEEQKSSQEGKTTDKSNSPSPIKLINNTTLNEYSPNSILPNTYQEDKGNISLEYDDEKYRFRNHNKEESKEMNINNLDRKYSPKNDNYNEEIPINIVIEEGKRVELGLKLKDFNEAFDELRSHFKDEPTASEIEEQFSNLEYLAFIRLIHDNPQFQQATEQSLAQLERDLAKELNNKKINFVDEEREKDEIIQQYIEKADKILSAKLPKCLIEPFKLNIKRIIDRRIKKEKVRYKESEIMQVIKEEY